MDCIIVDEDKVATDTIKNLISQVDYLSLKGDFNDTASAFDFLQHEPVDLIFLDTGKTGMEFFEKIKDVEHHAILILVGTPFDLSLSTFKFGHEDFLFKPVTPDRFITRIHKAKTIHESRNFTNDLDDREFLFVKNKSVISKINVSEILYVHALGDYVTVYTFNGQHTVHITLSRIEMKLSRKKFCRVHRSHIIAIRHIDHIEEGTVFINHHAVPVGEQYRGNLLKMIDII